jgi:catechol 2,3-dioxygenase-like lactoylglutathione lyase family enzyme
VTPAAPGSLQGVMLVVSDVDAARAELAKLGADGSEVFHFEKGLHFMGTKGRVPGRHPEGNSYGTFAFFRDPDGNGFLLQEITKRLPGRGFGSDVASVTELLREAEAHHGAYEASAPKHHWSDWYAAFVVARQRGKTPEVAVEEASLHTQSVLR